MKKILIFYASYGGGHLNAAKSIKECIDNNYTNCETELIDCNFEYVKDSYSVNFIIKAKKVKDSSKEKTKVFNDNTFLPKLTTFANDELFNNNYYETFEKYYFDDCCGRAFGFCVCKGNR